MHARSIVTILVAVAAALAFTGCGTTGGAPYFRVTDVEHGKVRRTPGEWKVWQVYDPAPTLQWEENDQCILDFKKLPCLRYGVSVSYETNIRMLDLRCRETRDKPIDYGEIERITHRNATATDFDWRVYGRNSESVLQRYLVAMPEEYFPTRIRVACKWNDEEVLAFDTTIVGAVVAGD